MATRVVLIDSYDSFTHNLAQALGSLGATVLVVRHDELRADELPGLHPDGIVLGPGPCTPDEAGITLDVIAQLEGTPILGVCLGHQAIGQHYGGRVVRAAAPVHGKTTPALHDGTGLYAGLPSPFPVGRYNSLLVDGDALPPCLRVTARSPSGEVLGLAHRQHPTEGVQFHPESILTPDGPSLLARWLERLTP
ncbi:MAG: aminodeoxychorismate/anthranilate synthase component II [Myxococcales bacterium]|nr:MAG: aminodeoxychorismate/anthranilate synthase component II [Myxococcales bacterium]